MAEEKKRFSWLTQDLLSVILNYSGFVIIFTVTICFIVIATMKSCSSPKELHPGSDIKKIQFVAVPKLKHGKSIVVSAELFKELQVTTDSINKSIKKFEEIKSEVVAIEERNKDDMKFYLTILGSIIAVVGFFGFKSINDTRESSIKFATDEAKLIAKKIAEEEAKDAIKVQHQDWTQSLATLTKNYEDILISLEPIGVIQTDLTKLHIRLKRVEGESTDESVTVETSDVIINDESIASEPVVPKAPDPEIGIKDIDTEDKFA
jgi:hypothetical protein